MSDGLPQPVVSVARWSNITHDGIIATIDGQELSLPNDPANAECMAVQRWVDAGNAIAEAPAVAVVVPDDITDRQFFQQLAIQGVITPDEAMAAVQTGTIPAAMLALVNELPVEQQFAAKMMIAGNVEFNRNHAVTLAIAALYQWTSAQVDALWIAASAL